MNFAVIPWDTKFCNNEIFNVQSPTNQNGLAEPYFELKGYLEENEHTICTIDLIEDYSKVDFFLFFEWIEEWMDVIIRKGFANRMVYCNAEPPTVRSLNSIEGYKKVCKYFPYVMTWNKDIVDNKTFFYRTIPYNFDKHDNVKTFDCKKLLTSISANKKSDYLDELYSERERLITFFENAIPDQFDMYGVGWDNSGHPSYKGRPESKFDTYQDYKFALALENTKNVKGYVTEKIFDCLTGNIVPIYMGAEDITDYVSKDCFIDYRDYKSPNELLDYLLSIDEERHNKYLEAARREVACLKEKGIFSGSEYARNILSLSNGEHKNSFKVSESDMRVLHNRVLKHKIIKRVKSFAKSIIRK